MKSRNWPPNSPCACECSCCLNRFQSICFWLALPCAQSALFSALRRFFGWTVLSFLLCALYEYFMLVQVNIQQKTSITQTKLSPHFKGIFCCTLYMGRSNCMSIVLCSASQLTCILLCRLDFCQLFYRILFRNMETVEISSKNICCEQFSFWRVIIGLMFLNYVAPLTRTRRKWLLRRFTYSGHRMEVP